MLTFNRMTLLLGSIAFASITHLSLADSPPIITIAPTSPIRCGQNEVFSFCGGCDKTCKNPNPVCPAICIPKCICRDNYIRDCDGKCVPWWDCLKPQPPCCPTCQGGQVCIQTPSGGRAFQCVTPG